MGDWQDVASGILARTPLVFLILGAAFLAIGATGGWPTIHIVVAEEPWRIALGICGAALTAAALWLASNEGHPKPVIDPREYDISISSPQGGEVTSPITISGHSKSLPEGWELWVFLIQGMGLTRKYSPVGPAEIKHNVWSVRVNVLNYKPGEKRKYGLFIVGRDGQCLTTYFRIAGQTLAPGGGWPPLTHLTSDTIPVPNVTCEVTLKSEAKSEAPGGAQQG